MNYDPNQPYSQSNPPPYGQPSQPPYGQPPQDPYGQPPSSYAPPPSPYGQPSSPYGAPPPPPPYDVPSYAQVPQQGPPKKSRRGLWIVLSIIAGVFVLSCGACALLGGFGYFLISGPSTAVNQYYQAVEQQKYATAYTYLRIDTFTLGGETFPANATVYERIATAIDTQRGTVTSHSIKNTVVNNNDATILVDVTRGGQTTEVTLQLQKLGNDWKITNIDRI